MKLRTSLSVAALLVAALLANTTGCSCDPTVAGPDGGVTVEDDAGVLAPPRLVAMQGENGIVTVVDIDSGEVSYPFGRANANGGLASEGEALLTFSESFLDVSTRGHVISYTPATKEVARGPLLVAAPETLASDGEAIAASYGDLASILVGTFDPDGEMDEHPTTYVGSSVSYDDTQLVVSVAQGLRLTDDEETILASRTCTGLVHDASDDTFLCADAAGDGLWSIGRDGSEVQVDGSAGAPFRSLTLLEDGSFLAPRRDCSVLTDISLSASVVELCPQQFAEQDGRLFFTAAGGGGLYEIVDGDVWLRLVSAAEGGGLGSATGRYAVAGSLPSHVQVARADGSEPWRTGELGSVRGVALDDEGGLWVAEGTSLWFYDGASAGESIVSGGELVRDLVRVGDELYLSRANEMVGRLLMADGASASLEDTALPEPARMGGCAAALVYYDEDNDVVGRLTAAGSEVLLEDASESVGGVSGIGCLEDTLLVASENGEVWSRGFDDSGEPELLVELPSPARHITRAAE